MNQLKQHRPTGDFQGHPPANRRLTGTPNQRHDDEAGGSDEKDGSKREGSNAVRAPAFTVPDPLLGYLDVLCPEPDLVAVNSGFNTQPGVRNHSGCAGLCFPDKLAVASLSRLFRPGFLKIELFQIIASPGQE
jgi:hypothetical protein